MNLALASFTGSARELSFFQFRDELNLLLFLLGDVSDGMRSPWKLRLLLPFS